MQEFYRITCDHLTSDDEFMTVRGPAPEKIVEKIPKAEICYHAVRMVIPCPPGFEKEEKKKSVNEGRTLSVLIVRAGTALMIDLPREGISSEELKNYRSKEMWRE